MKYFLYLFLIVSSLVHAQTHVVKLGDTKVRVIKLHGRGKTFVHLHESEFTALAAAKCFIKREGGSLITLKHSGKRNVEFYLRGVHYEFDPNRIFTDKGIKRTLKKYGPYSLAAHREVKKLANKIIRLLPKGKVISVHNNRNYSIKEYFPNRSLAKDAKALHYRAFTNHRNFYFVTKKEDYERLKRLNFNVALQSNHAQDDGSLSYYLATKNYINIESGYGEMVAQLKMLHYA
ncbi:protein tyrosine phosphatase [Legionella micdadei]|uniref:protein tyrosine phosphatase n=1 Tax=Legionella micdadei TaxID=451 RepID=UPI0009EF7721|nr:protein tyrosine phosphatase [Legionella micdadei]ARG99340.1 protein tyrosine phosphatase [Legionella micdadei]